MCLGVCVDRMRTAGVWSQESLCHSLFLTTSHFSKRGAFIFQNKLQLARHPFPPLIHYPFSPNTFSTPFSTSSASLASYGRSLPGIPPAAAKCLAPSLTLYVFQNAFSSYKFINFALNDILDW